MSFKLGTFDTDSVTGFKAILKEWPTLPVDLALDELPVGDGSLFYRTRMESTEWEFNLELTGKDLTEVFNRADTITKAINPSLLGGPRNFTPNAFDGWVWQGVVSEGVKWERDEVLWFSTEGVCVLRGTVTISTPNPYGYKAGTSNTLTAPGTLNLVPAAGHTGGFYPVVRFRGVLAADQAFIANGVTVTGPLTASQTMVLDFEKMSFYVMTTSSGAKVREIADRITNFTRLFGNNSLNISCSVNAGTFTEATAVVNSRKI